MKPPVVLVLALLMAGCGSPMDSGGGRVVTLTAGWDSLGITFANIQWSYGGETHREYVARRAGGWTDSMDADSAYLRISTTGDFWGRIEVDGETVAYARDTTGVGLIEIGWHK